MEIVNYYSFEVNIWYKCTYFKNWKH